MNPAGGGARLAAATVATGIAAGLSGAALVLLLHAVQHVSFGYTENTFFVGVEHASHHRRVLALAVGGLVTGVGWWLLRRVYRGNVSITHALRSTARLPVFATTVDACLQIVAVGAGASIGREGAPRQVAAMCGAQIAQWARLRPQECRLLLAAGAGAGLGAVYNVPVGGAIFAVELLLTDRRPRDLVVALGTNVIATLIAWPFLGTEPTYAVHGVRVNLTIVLAVLLVGVLSGVLGQLVRRMVTSALAHAPSGPRAVGTIVLTFLLLGVAAIPAPQLLGNGKNLTQLIFDGKVSMLVAVAFTIAKPLATAACLRSGAIGGVLTPAFTTGASLGLAVGLAAPSLIPSGDVVTLALAGAAAMLAIVQRAPVTAVVLAMELAHAPVIAVVPVVVCVGAALIASRGTSAALRRIGEGVRAIGSQA